MLDRPTPTQRSLRYATLLHACGLVLAVSALTCFTGDGLEAQPCGAEEDCNPALDVFGRARRSRAPRPALTESAFGMHLHAATTVELLDVAAPGAVAPDFASLPLRRIVRPKWPLDLHIFED